MKIVKDYPPNIDVIRETFPGLGPRAVFTYGDTIYAPHIVSEKEIETHLHVHEGVHEEQQKNGPKEWWDRYLKDPGFRLSQELEAYGEQYKYIQSLDVPARLKKHFLFRIASDLASPMYGSMLSYAEAESKIRNAAKAV